jgi:RimJ/RimL family protein N-acetyltransferase
MAVELETERLRLRQWREDDVDGLYEFYDDPHSRSIYAKEFTREDVWRRIALYLGHWQIRGFGPLAIEEKATGKFVGSSGLWFPESWGDVEIGYGIHPAFRGRGYASEAAARAREYGYSIGIKRLVSYIQPSNARSIRVAEKLGAKPDGTFNLHGNPHLVYIHPNT